MDPTVISDTIQVFRGKRYYLCGRYFQRNGRRLHVAVWEASNGRVPSGHHVHHRDHVKSHNWLGNLELLSRSEHLRHHGRETTEAQRNARKRNVEMAREGNKAIPVTTRSRAAKDGWAAVTLTEVACEMCGTVVSTPHPSRTRFCGGTCKARARRARLKHDDR